MFRHVIQLRFRDGTSAEQIAGLHAALAELPARIPEIRRYHFGGDARLVDGNWDFALVAEFDSAAGYLVYRNHPAHLAVIEHHIKPILNERAAVQFDSSS